MSVESEKPGPAGSSEELREQKRKRDAVYPLNRPVDCLIDLAEDVSALTDRVSRDTASPLSSLSAAGPGGPLQRRRTHVF